MLFSSTKTTSSSMAAILLLFSLFTAHFYHTGAESVGVCYGMLGNNLPSQQDTISLYRSNNIRRMRLYDPNRAALDALRNTGIEVILGVPNSELRSLTNPSNARSWVQNNVQRVFPSVRIKYINVGNEVNPGNGGGDVLPAMRNVYDAIRAANLQNQIKVSTAIDTTLIGKSFPPSAGEFRGDIRWYIDPIIQFLTSTNSPLLANIYPYFSYANNPRDISLSYALFTSSSVVVQDGSRGYRNLFDAMLDALYSAVERSGGGSLPVVVSETGWPSAGGFGTSNENAGTYYRNMIAHVRGNNGTPKRPGRGIETYLFAMYDENQKNPELEKHFGVFYPNKQPKFPLSFGATSFTVVDGYGGENAVKADV